MKDKAHKQTDKIIEEMEQAIRLLYSSRQAEIQGIFNQFFEKYKDEDEIMRQKVEEGVIDKQEYVNWRQKTILRDKQYKQTIKKMSAKYTEILQEAVALANGRMKEVYGLNYDFVGKEIEKQVRTLK